MLCVEKPDSTGLAAAARFIPPQRGAVQTAQTACQPQIFDKPFYFSELSRRNEHAHGAFLPHLASHS
jgi:hypothetical protein